MLTMEKNRLAAFLEDRSQADWLAALDQLSPSIHPVDREAVFIWFAFWPLELKAALSDPSGRDEIARLMDLEGNWRLEEQIDSSVSFLYGAHYWAPVKKAVLSLESHEGGSLAETIRKVAAAVAASEGIDASLVLGIAAVGLMMLRQVGREAIERVRDEPATPPLLPRNPGSVVASRERKSGDGLFTFLRGVNRRWDVRWEERRPGGVFRAFNGQDIAMAGASTKDAATAYRKLDYRRIDGPVPVECRVGSCGYCWVGVLAGRDNLSAMTPFERERLRYFGYDTVNGVEDPRPLVRLACQAQCHGDVTLTIPPWNGELSRRHDEGRKKLGTA